MELDEIIERGLIEELNVYVYSRQLKAADSKYIIKRLAISKWNFNEEVFKKNNLYWYYFYASLVRIKDVKEQLEFIDNHLDFFDTWYSVDSTIQYLKRNWEFSLPYKYANKYVNDKRTFVRRFGYVIFFANLVTEENIPKIEMLLHDDEEYYVQMAEAWLLAEFVCKVPEMGYSVLEHSSLKYNILGKAIQKCCDSFRIDSSTKERLKNLRKIKKDN